MASLQYGNDKGHGQTLSDKNYYSQFVHLPNGITKLSGQGGYSPDGTIDGNDHKGQIEKAFDNVETVLKAAGLSGWDDVFLMRSYMLDMNDFPYYVEVMKKKIPRRIVYTALSVPKLAGPKMLIEIEVEAWRPGTGK